MTPVHPDPYDHAVDLCFTLIAIHSYFEVYMIAIRQCTVAVSFGVDRPQTTAITGEHSIQNQIWCVNIREYMVFGSIVGSDYYGMAPRNKITKFRNKYWYMMLSRIGVHRRGRSIAKSVPT